MKKLIFIIILFFNLIPVLKKGEIRFSGPETALADMFGGELDEVIVTPEPEPDEPEEPVVNPEPDFPDDDPEQVPEDPDDNNMPQEETSPGPENDITDPCLKGLVDNVINGNTANPFSNILKTAFGANSEKTLTFYQYNDPAKSNEDGKAGGGSQWQLEIGLNLAALDYSSNENITATIYHEIIHGYLLTQGVYGENLQHNIIANEWRGIISAQLQADYPNISQADADALAWGGLGESQLWQQMYQSDQTNNTGITGAIAQTIQNHKNLNDQNSGTHGTHCN